MMRTWVAAKLHGITVTGASVDYNGSVSLCPYLMEQAGISEYEQVHVVNLATGDRWITYALAGDQDMFTLNGGSARLGEVGDRCVVMTFAQGHRAPEAPVLFLDTGNRIIGRVTYGEAAGR
jgi:aspartate 1-decarboxylase